MLLIPTTALPFNNLCTQQPFPCETNVGILFKGHCRFAAIQQNKAGEGYDDPV
jgi:hypothetical protein